MDEAPATREDDVKAVRYDELQPPDPKVVAEIVERIRPLLGGHHPAVQSSVIADLLAMWLAGHEHDIREALLDSHIGLVRELVPVNVAAMGVWKK
jgi:hypothetical protein